jgi:hypothetical protein
MSKIKLQGNASGTGTTTFQSANTSSNTTFTLPGTDGTNGQVLTTDGAGALTFTTVSGGGGTTTNALTMNSGGAGDASGTTFNGSAARTISYNTIGAAATGAANTFTAAQTFRAASAIRSEAASTQDAIVVAGRAGGTSSYAATLTPTTLSANRTVTIPDETFTVGFRNVPAVGTKTGSYSLAVGDVGKYVQIGSGGSITIPDATFAEGDIISLFNNTTGNITITCTITTAYIAGTDTDKATMTLATRGVATILFISSTVCVVSGNVS